MNEVLKRLDAAKLNIDIEKSEFYTQEVKYLGVIISTDGLKMDPSKVQTVMEWQTPRSVKDVLSFLGFANFYRMFIQAFSRIAYPLTDLTRGSKERPFNWTPVCQEAFEKLKLAFTSAPVLKHFNPDVET